jgi:hypothetical protein
VVAKDERQVMQVSKDLHNSDGCEFKEVGGCHASVRSKSGSGKDTGH